jgi:hypothetical protein
MDGLRRRSILKLMRGPRIQYKSGTVRPDWSWQPGRAKKQFKKELREREVM